MSEDSLRKVREAVKSFCEKNLESYDDVDLKRVEEDDRYVQRFLDSNNQNVDNAVKQLDETLRWRKSYGVNHLKRSDFPREFSMIGELFTYAKDKNGIPTVYCRVQLHRAVADWKETMKRFIVCIIEEMEKKAREAGTAWGLIFDCRNGRVLDVEIDLDYFAIKTLVAHYPRAMEYIIVHEIPTVLWAIFKLIQSWMPTYYKERFMFLNKAKMKETIGVENLPDFLEGTCEQAYYVFHDACVPFEEYAKVHGLNDEAVKRILSKYGPLILESEQRIGKTRKGEVI